MLLLDAETRELELLDLGTSLRHVEWLPLRHWEVMEEEVSGCVGTILETGGSVKTGQSRAGLGFMTALLYQMMNQNGKENVLEASSHLQWEILS